MENKQSSSKTLSIIALVCGIIGIVGAWIPNVDKYTLVFSIAAIVLGAIGMKQAKDNNEPKSLAVAGLVLGIVGVASGVIVLLCVGCVACAACGLASAQ